MGLFTDKCTNPECGRRVRKNAKFCPACGAAAPKGQTTCGACGADVRTAGKFCWRCGSDLAAVRKPAILDDRWARSPGDFAVRVDDQDIQGWLRKPLIIEHGTRALIFQAGKFKGEAREGKYDLGGFLKRLNHFLADLNATVILMDAGDVSVDLEAGGLWTADRFEVGCVVRVVVQVSDPDALYVNLFKGGNRVTVAALREELAGEAQMLLAGIVAQHPAERLFSDVSIRGAIQASLNENLAETLRRFGIKLEQLRFIDFAGEAYDRVRREEGELAVESRRVGLVEQRAKLATRLRETLTQQKLEKFQSAKDFEAYVRQTEHELGLKEVIRADEMETLRARFEHQRDREALLRRIEVEGIADDAAREKAWEDLLAAENQRDERHARDLKRQLAEATGDAEKRRIELEIAQLEHERDMQEARDGIALMKEVSAAEQDTLDREQRREAALLEARSKATAQALMTIVDGPAADRIAALETLRARESMSPEQILALAAEASPEAAKALAAKYTADGQVSDAQVDLLTKQLDDQRQLADAHADRMERLMQTAMSQMGAVAATAARPVDPKQTIVAGGGAGRPVVINPQSPPGPAATCKHCGQPTDPGAAFCAECGKKL